MIKSWFPINQKSNSVKISYHKHCASSYIPIPQTTENSILTIGIKNDIKSKNLPLLFKFGVSDAVAGFSYTKETSITTKY